MAAAGGGTLQAQGANPFRVGAYRKAADTVERFDGSLRTLFAMKGRDGLAALPGIGAGLASAIAKMLETGRWAQLERLRGSLDQRPCSRLSQGLVPSWRSEFTIRSASRPRSARGRASRGAALRSRGWAGAVSRRSALPSPRSSIVHGCATVALFPPGRALRRSTARRRPRIS